MKTKLAIGASIVGVIALVFGIVQIISGFFHSHVSATVTGKEAAYIMTEPGVLDLLNTTVHVEVNASDKKSPVRAIVGVSDDVKAWCEGLPVVDVIALSSWEKFNVKDYDADIETPPSVLGSDMWLIEKSGKGSLSFDYKVQQRGGVSLLVQSEGAAPELTLSWVRANRTGSGIPLTVIGLLLLGISFILMLLGRNEERGLDAWHSNKEWLNKILNAIRAWTRKLTHTDDEANDDTDDTDTSVPDFSTFTAEPRRRHTSSTTVHAWGDKEDK